MTREDGNSISNAGGFFIEAVKNVLSFSLFSRFPFFKALFQDQAVSAKPSLLRVTDASLFSVLKCLFGSTVVNEGFAMTHKSSDHDSSNL